MTEPVRIGLVGYGLGGRAFHAPLIVSANELALVGVVTTSDDRREQLAEDHPGVPAVDSLRALVEAGAEAVAISSTTGTHTELTDEALSLGLHVVCDKPLAVEATAARESVALAERLGLLLTAYQNRRWDSDFLTIKRLLAEQVLGDVFRFESRFERWAPGAPRAWWRAELPPEQGGGVRLDLKTSKGAIHSLVVGKPSGARAGYVRAVGASPSYLARPQLMVDAQPARWLDTSLLDIAATRVAAVTLRGGTRPARTLQGAQLPSELAGALAALALQDLRPRPLEPSGGSGPPTRRARFLLRDGITIDVEGVEDGPRRWIRLAASFEAANAMAKPEDLAAEAKRLATRLDGREFEIPSYRYSTLFALDPAAAPSPAALPGLQGRFD